MPFRPEVNQTLRIDELDYCFTEHPAAPGMPYGQTGRRATVYQVQANGTFHALKVFTEAFRSPRAAVNAKQLRAFAELPGLQAVSRQVLVPSQHEGLLKTHPDLAYAVLMPWIGGTTWQELLSTGAALIQDESLALAREFCNVLKSLEARGAAHCDLSGPNVMVQREPLSVALVDLEDLYAPGWTQPEKLPGGSAGYAHKTAPKGLWSAESDRFAGAVLLAEMLGWCDERIRKAAWGESYFAPEEMQQEHARYHLLVEVLHERWGAALTEAFQAAWLSQQLGDAASFTDWELLLDGGDGESDNDEIVDGGGEIISEPDPLEETAQQLYTQFKTQLEQGNLAAAERLFRAIEAIRPGYRDAATLLQQARRSETEIRKLTGEIASQQKRLAQLEARIAEKRGILAQERQTLEAQLQDLAKREATQQEQRAALNGWQDRLQEALAQLQTRQWVEARSKLNAVRQALDTALAAEEQKPLEKADAEKPENVVELPPVVTGVSDEASPQQTLATITSLPAARASSDFVWVSRLQPVHSISFLTDSRVPKAVTDLSFSPNGEYLAIAGASREIWVVKVVGGKKQNVLSEHSKNVSGIAFAAEEQLVSFSEDETIRLWNLRSSASKGYRVQIPEYKSPFRAGAYSSAAKILAVGSQLNTQIWSLNGSLMINLARSATCLAFSPNGGYLASGAEDGNIRFWNVTTNTPVLMRLEHKAAVHDVTYSPNGQWIATGADDGMARIWNAQTGDLVRAFEMSSRPVFSVAFSPDSSVLATAGDTGHIRLWNSHNGTLIQTLCKRDAPVHCVVFSPRVGILASGSADGTVQIWSAVP